MKVEFYMSQRISSNNILLSYSPKKSHPKRNDGGADTSMLEAQVYISCCFLGPFCGENRDENQVKNGDLFSKKN